MGFCFRPSTPSPPLQGPVSFVRHFSYKNIKKATDGFCRIIYSDTDGAAYRATLRDVGVALVKEVKAFNLGNDLFYQEVQLLGRLHHRHLLPLKSFSMGYKRYMCFSSMIRQYIVSPSVRARFVGRELSSKVIQSLTPRLVGDAEGTNSSSSKDGMDTSYNNVMFQLGVLILELITGQSSEQGGSDLIEWVQQNHTGSMHKRLDPDLGNDYNSNELKDLLNVARLCIKFRDMPVLSSPASLPRYLWKKNNVPVN